MPRVACSSSTTTSRKPHEERRPALVEREDPLVHHLGVREQHGGVLAGPGAVVGRRVAVVGDRAQTRDEPAAQRPELVLGERLGGEDQQRGVGVAAHRGVDDRQLVAERLARRGSGGDDHVLTCREGGRSPRPGACRARRCRGSPSRASTSGWNGVLQRRGARGARGQRGAVDDPLEELGRGGDGVERRDGVRRRLGGHRRSIARGCVRGRARQCDWRTASSRKSWNRLAAPGPSARLLPEPLTTGTSTFFTCAGSIDRPSRPRP